MYDKRRQKCGFRRCILDLENAWNDKDLAWFGEYARTDPAVRHFVACPYLYPAWAQRALEGFRCRSRTAVLPFIIYLADPVYPFSSEEAASTAPDNVDLVA
jgi:hypothetical protein